MRKTFRMSEGQYEKLMDAMKSGPLIMLQCGPGMSPQERANAAWASLGKEMGFDPMSVRPTPYEGSNLEFTAIPVAGVM